MNQISAGGPSGAGHPSQAIRVFILDDHELARRGLRDLLEVEGFEVVGESATAREATRLIPLVRPDVALLNARVIDGTGIEVCREVRSTDPSIRCLLLTSYDDDHALRGAVLAGAQGYVLKQIRATDLLSGLRRAARGESLVDVAVEARVVAGLAALGGDPRIGLLGPLEKRVLTLIAKGLDNFEIAHELAIADSSLRTHLSSVLAKLGFEPRVLPVRGSVARTALSDG